MVGPDRRVCKGKLGTPRQLGTHKGMVNARLASRRSEMHQMPPSGHVVHGLPSAWRACGLVVKESAVSNVDVSKDDIRHGNGGKERPDVLVAHGGGKVEGGDCRRSGVLRELQGDGDHALVDGVALDEAPKVGRQ
jgi:hypothetical protein